MTDILELKCFPPVPAPLPKKSPNLCKCLEKIFMTDRLELKCFPPAPAPLPKKSPNLCKCLEKNI